jgi:CTP:phosphocholine cytidylyltransferase-like protein
MKISSNIIILGAKPIKGMRSLGAISNIPISGKKSILDLQLQNLNRRFSCDNVIYIRGHMGEYVQHNQNKYSISYIDNPEYDTKNNGSSLKLSLPHLYKHSSTLVLFSKILFNYHIFDGINKKLSSSIFIDNHIKNQYKIGCNINHNVINNLFYGLNNKLCGIYFLSGEENKTFLKLLENQSNMENAFVFEIINSIIDSGGKFLPAHVDHRWVNQIDSNYSLKKTIKYYAKNFSA